MQDIIFSPVPIKQRPLTEFLELKDSFIFSWPTKGTSNLHFNLLLCWFFSLPIFILIGSGSYSLSSNIIKLILTSLLSSSIIPLFILTRQYLSE